MEEFRMMTQPQFPIYSVGNQGLRFYPLLEEDSSPPRLVYVRDGSTVFSWDEDMPGYEALLEGLVGNGYVQNNNGEETEESGAS